MKFKTVRLTTPNLAKQKEFYIDKLGLKLLSDGGTFFSVQAGESVLEFEQRTDLKREGYYHFCFNVAPSLLEDAATNYLPSRHIPLIKAQTDDIYVTRENWNSKSVYFYDADENIVEFIARYNLPYPTSDTTFDINKHQRRIQGV